MTKKIVAAFRDPEQKCVFVRYEGGVIDIHSLNGDYLWRWMGDPDDDRNPDPEGIVWAALTGQQAGEAKISMENLPKRSPNVAKFYADDEPLTATNCEGAIAKLERIRAAARKMSIDQGGVRDNQDVKALLVEIFAP